MYRNLDDGLVTFLSCRFRRVILPVAIESDVILAAQWLVQGRNLVQIHPGQGNEDRDRGNCGTAGFRMPPRILLGAGLAVFGVGAVVPGLVPSFRACIPIRCSGVGIGVFDPGSPYRALEPDARTLETVLAVRGRVARIPARSECTRIA